MRPYDEGKDKLKVKSEKSKLKGNLKIGIEISDFWLVKGAKRSYHGDGDEIQNSKVKSQK